eukprot:COSAG06_NODE_3714_length_4984_cov_4.544115_1_plen_63_part_10
MLPTEVLTQPAWHSCNINVRWSPGVAALKEAADEKAAVEAAAAKQAADAKAAAEAAAAKQAAD